MPIKVQSDLPAKAIIEKENIFIMDETRAISQDIRPLEIVLVNLMPLKEATEIQLIRALSNTPLQVNLTFVAPKNHKAKNTPVSHLNQFYTKFDDIRDKNFDGLIITGAPIEKLEFEEVDFWNEIEEIMDWSEGHITSSVFLCWAAQAAFYHFYGINKRPLERKLSGVYKHVVHHRKTPLVRGFDDVFWAPHSRNTETLLSKIRQTDDVVILADSDEAGIFLAMTKDGKKIFIMGHPEYDRNTLQQEYVRDLKAGIDPDIPVNYFPDDDPEKIPILTWRGHANTLYTNWLNYYVYQETPYDLSGTFDSSINNK